MRAHATTTQAGEALVLTSRQGAVLEITLNRPERRNAITRAVSLGVAAALDELDADRELRAAIITGAGGCFSSGMDLAALVDGESAWIEDRGFAGAVIRSSAKPLIAAIEGFAVAGGFELVLACDLAVMANDAYFSLPEAKRGLVPVGGGIVRLARRLPEGLARELVLTGDRVGADWALRHGLVNRVTEPGQALAAARELARAIAANAPLATIAAKCIFEEHRDWEAGEVWKRQHAIADAVHASADAREGSLAYLEKREPRWEAR